MKALVVGDTGLLGQAFVQTALKQGHVVCGISTSSLPPFTAASPQYQHRIFDLRTQFKEINGLIKAFAPDIILNAAAHASIPFCEQHPAEAAYLNVEVPRLLAAAAAACGCYNVHISSDQVFDGTAQVPYREDAAAKPLNAYGKMKKESENSVLKSNPEALVIRTNIVGFKGHGEPTFVEWLLKAVRSGVPVTLFTNYVTSSIHVDLLSEIIFQCYSKRLRGLVHIASKDSASKYEFGRQLFEKLGLDFTPVQKGFMTPASLSPPRPAFLALDSGRAETALAIHMPDIAQTIGLLVSQSASKPISAVPAPLRSKN